MIRKISPDEEKFIRDVIWDWDRAREIMERSIKNKD